MKKPKVIHLSETAIESLTIQAVKNKTNFKNFVENYLEQLAVGGVRQKNKK